MSGPDPSAARGWSCRITYAVISLATLAMGAGRVAPGPYTTPTPPMSAAEAPSDGHETAASRSRSAASDPAARADVPEGRAVGEDRAVGPAGGLCSFAMTKPARQPRAARQANAVTSVRLVQRRR